MFTTTRSTLARDDNSMLARLAAGVWQTAMDENGAYLIDRDPTYFAPILNWLRHGEIVLDTGVNRQGRPHTNVLAYVHAHIHEHPTRACQVKLDDWAQDRHTHTHARVHMRLALMPVSPPPMCKRRCAHVRVCMCMGLHGCMCACVCVSAPLAVLRSSASS